MAIIEQIRVMIVLKEKEVIGATEIVCGMMNTPFVRRKVIEILTLNTEKLYIGTISKYKK